MRSPIRATVLPGTGIIIGLDYHPGMQQVAFVDTETGEYGERELNHSTGEAEKFYRDLQQRGFRVRVGMEATGHGRWFERLMAELGFELWIGDPAEIKAARVRKQKTDREDARLLLRLLREDRFPRIVGSQPTQSGSASAAVASTSAGADENSGDEPVAGHRYE